MEPFDDPLSAVEQSIMIVFRVAALPQRHLAKPARNLTETSQPVREAGHHAAPRRMMAEAISPTICPDESAGQ